jgi:DNA polymerase (family 10)
MNKDQVAAILDEIGTLLELQGENSFRCNAYHNAARTLEQLDTDLGEVVRSGQLASIRGIGDTLREKITTLVTAGKLPYYEDLKKKTPPGLFDMLRLPGIGPKKVRALYEQLKIDDLDKLREACEDDRVAGLKGFGEKTQQKILDGLAFLNESGGRVRIDHALVMAQGLMDGLRNAPGIIRMELGGSLRRRRETIADIDILISSDDAAPIMAHFVKLPGVVQVISHGDTLSSVKVSNGMDGSHRIVMQADLRVVRDEVFPFALQHFSGSKQHNVHLRGLAQSMGLKSSEYGLVGEHRKVVCKTEADIYHALGLDYIPPEMREDTGEVELAAEHKIPKLIEVGDIQGVFHNHTTASDGSNTLEEMAEAARALGLHYLGIGDHSQSLAIANGLSPARVRKQQEEIDALNRKYKNFRLFKGTECDILADGSLDFDDELLATFDYVVASVHTSFNMTREEMTARIIRAIRHPAVTMLGHATGRLLLKRDGYPVDLEAVLQAAAEAGTMIEINAQPSRLELDWVHCKRAKALGIPLVINPDGHHTTDLALYPFGVQVARRGWLTKEDVFNTRSAAEVAKEFARRKKEGKSGHAGRKG